MCVITEKRYDNTKALDKIVKACEFTNVTYGKDADGHFIAGYTAPAWFAAMPTRQSDIPVVEKIVVAKSVAPKGPRGNGLCQHIRGWVLANPTATKADTLKQFPTANPSTVAVQFGHARKALAA